MQINQMQNTINSMNTMGGAASGGGSMSSGGGGMGMM
jgi:hypothetical protein